MTLAVMVNLLVQYLRILKGELLVDKAVGGTFKEGILNDSYRQIHSRAHGQHCNQDDVFAHFLLPILVYKLLTLEMHHTHPYKSGETDKHGIDKIKVECAEEVNQIARCQPVTCRTERWHQRRGNGNAGNHISFLFGRKRSHTCQASHQGDEYIINSGRCTCQQFRLPFGNGADQKKYGSCSHTEQSGYQEALQ